MRYVCNIYLDANDARLDSFCNGEIINLEKETFENNYYCVSNFYFVTVNILFSILIFLFSFMLCVQAYNYYPDVRHAVVLLRCY